VGVGPIDFFSSTQRRSRFAFSPWANATAAIDTPRPVHSSTTFALNSACGVCDVEPLSILGYCFMCPPILFGGHDRGLPQQPDQDDFIGRLVRQ
jgi:hypothetical protein